MPLFVMETSHCACHGTVIVIEAHDIDEALTFLREFEPEFYEQGKTLLRQSPKSVLRIRVDYD